MFTKRLSLRPFAEATVDYQTKSFTAFTRSLIDFRDCCKTEGVTQIEMESTGIYWKSLFIILDVDFKVILVNARHINNVPKHKTDKKDSIKISTLLLVGYATGFESSYRKSQIKCGRSSNRIRICGGSIQRINRIWNPVSILLLNGKKQILSIR